MKPLSLAPILLLALAACSAPRSFPPVEIPRPPVAAPAPEPAPGGMPQADLSSCGGQALVGLIGQNASALPAAGEWGALRVIPYGAAVTMDYSASRLNVNIDPVGTIIDLFCG